MSKIHLGKLSSSKTIIFVKSIVSQKSQLKNRNYKVLRSFSLMHLRLIFLCHKEEEEEEEEKEKQGVLNSL